MIKGFEIPEERRYRRLEEHEIVVDPEYFRKTEEELFPSPNVNYEGYMFFRRRQNPQTQEWEYYLLPEYSIQKLTQKGKLKVKDETIRNLFLRREVFYRLVNIKRI